MVKTQEVTSRCYATVAAKPKVQGIGNSLVSGVQGALGLLENYTLL